MAAKKPALKAEVKEIEKLASLKAVKQQSKKKSKRALKGVGASDYLSMINPYVMTVADPWGVRGVKIPDEITTPSTAFTLTQRGVLTAAAGETSVALTLGWCCSTSDQRMYRVGLIPLPNSTNANFAYTVGQVLRSTTDTFSPVAVASVVPINLSSWNTASPTVPGLFNLGRIVSAGMSMQYTGAPLNASGMFTSSSVPLATLRNRFNTSWSATQLQNLPGSSVSPINDFAGTSCRYLPYGPECNQYVQLDVDAESVQEDDGTDIERHTPGGLTITATGMPAGAWSVSYAIVINFEAIPKTSSASFITTETSKSDPIMMAHASNVLTELPPGLPSAKASETSPPAAGGSGAPGQDMQIHETPVARTPEHEAKLKKSDSSPLGFLGSLLDGVPNVLKDSAGVLSKVAPLAMALL